MMNFHILAVSNNSTDNETVVMMTSMAQDLKVTKMINLLLLRPLTCLFSLVQPGVEGLKDQVAKFLIRNILILPNNL